MTTLLERPAEPGVLDPDRTRRWTRLRKLPVDFYTLAALLPVVLLVQGWNITNYPTVSDDEGTYLSQAWAVQHGHGLAHYTYWYDHPPFGWIQIATLSWLPTLVFPGLVVAHARVVMLLVTAFSAVLLYVLCRRLTMARWSAALAVLLFALSPLSVTLQREIFLDNFAVVWMLAAFVLALSPRRHLWHHVAAGGCAALSILSKETVIVVLPALFVALWQGSDRSTRKFSLVGLCSALVLIGSLYPLYALLKGELLAGRSHVSLVSGLTYQMQRAGSGSVLVPGTGSNAVLRSWLFYDDVLITGGVVAVVVALAFRQLRAPAVAGVLLVLMAMRPNGYLPAMYVIQALPFFAITLAGLAEKGTAALLTWRVGMSRWETLLRRAALTVTAMVVAGYVLPQWYDGNSRAMTSAPNANYAAAANWIHGQIPDPQSVRIVVDDALWLDMVRDGFQPGLGAIWFYKVDLDPSVQRALPNGWRDINYVVSSPTIRQDPNGLPAVRAALEHSRVLATFGTGADRIEIRQIIQRQP